ncbi:MAG: cobalt ECF transporter T component CbiQ [Christensenellales bacterium]
MSKLFDAMADLTTVEQLAAKDTAVHRLHPMAKLLTAFAFIVATVSCERYHPLRLAPFVFYPVFLAVFAELPFGRLLKRAVLALPFAILAGASNLFFDKAPAAVVLGVSLSGGTLAFLTVVAKAYLCVLALLLLTATTALSDLSSQLVRLKVPPVMVSVLTMTYRYLSTLMSEAYAMSTAYALRSPNARGVKFAHMGQFAGHLLIKSADRAERVYAAMKLRGFSGPVPGSKGEPMKKKDWAYLLLMLAAVTVARVVDLPSVLGGFLGGIG